MWLLLRLQPNEKTGRDLNGAIEFDYAVIIGSGRLVPAFWNLRPLNDQLRMNMRHRRLRQTPEWFFGGMLKTARSTTISVT